MMSGPAPIAIRINPAKCVSADPGSRIGIETVAGSLPNLVDSEYRFLFTAVSDMDPVLLSVAYAALAAIS